MIDMVLCDCFSRVVVLMEVLTRLTRLKLGPLSNDRKSGTSI